jgi:hypothetical protein
MRGGEEKPLIEREGRSVMLRGSDAAQHVEEVEKDVDFVAPGRRACGADGSHREPVSVGVEIELPKAGS